MIAPSEFVTYVPVGAAKAFTDNNGSPIFLQHLEGWIKGVREKLLQWNNRLRSQVHDPTQVHVVF